MEHQRMIDVLQANKGKKVALVLVSGRLVSGIITDMYAGLIRLADDDEDGEIKDDGTASFVKEEFVMALEEERTADTEDRAKRREAKAQAKRGPVVAGAPDPDRVGNEDFPTRGAHTAPGTDGRVSSPGLPGRAGDLDFQRHVDGVAQHELATNLGPEDATAMRKHVERNLVTHDEERTDHPVAGAPLGASVSPGDPRRVIIPDEPGLKADHADGSHQPQSAHLGRAEGFDESDAQAAAAEHHADDKK